MNETLLPTEAPIHAPYSHAAVPDLPLPPGERPSKRLRHSLDTMAWSPQFTDIALVVPRVLRLFNLHDSVASIALSRATAASTLAPEELDKLSTLRMPSAPAFLFPY